MGVLVTRVNTPSLGVVTPALHASVPHCLSEDVEVGYLCPSPQEDPSDACKVDATS